LKEDIEADNFLVNASTFFFSFEGAEDLFAIFIQIEKKLLSRVSAKRKEKPAQPSGRVGKK
jgi:hypothetical protein